jgi:hypothetical protein
MGVSVIDDKIYLFGGDTGRITEKYVDTINVFDTKTNGITTSSVTLPFACECIGAASTGGNIIYLFGGGDSSKRIHEFVVHELPLEEGKLCIDTNSSDNIFNIITTNEIEMKIGVKSIYIGGTEEYNIVDAYLHKEGKWTSV